MIIKCKKCNHQWNYRSRGESNYEYVTCPACYRKIKKLSLEENKIEVTE